MGKNLIRGRFKENLDKLVEKFLAGKDILYDIQLIPYDIYNNFAHHIMLNKIGAISDEDIKAILIALKEIYKDWGLKKFRLKQELEDVHMNIEKAVADQVGPFIGGRMHLARSRNDQILTDLRLFMRDEIIEIQDLLIDLISTLLKKAEENLDTLYIGYTHTQQAQPITFAHWCMAHVDALYRDLERLIQTYYRVNTNPLGAAAIAGTSWPIDRQYTAELLGFEGIQENTLDVVSSRGEFLSDLLSNFTIIMIHLGRIAEDLILGTTSEFGYITLSDRYSTGSSIMPHKKNPDVLELIRARTGVMLGNLTKVFGILKGLPSGYNRDHQELKEPLFSSIETIKPSLKVLTGLLATIKLNKEVIKRILQNNFLMATELVDLLIKEWNIPFRTAYTLIATYIKENPEKNEFHPETLKEFLNKSKNSNQKNITLEMIQSALDPLEAIKRRNHIGGPSPQEEQRMILDRKEKLEKMKEKILNNKKKINQVFSQLLRLVDTIIAK
ncbi:MAG: argininosuccinate lyase [Candidatus Helarchaeota archaeon]